VDENEAPFHLPSLVLDDFRTMVLLPSPAGSRNRYFNLFYLLEFQHYFFSFFTPPSEPIFPFYLEDDQSFSYSLRSGRPPPESFYSPPLTENTPQSWFAPSTALEPPFHLRSDAVVSSALNISLAGSSSLRHLNPAVVPL